MNQPVWPQTLRNTLRPEAERTPSDRIRIPAIAAAACFLFFSPSAFSAWDFVPTPLEYQSWPEYCRVQFTTVSDGFSVPGVQRYSSATVEEWRSIVGEPQYSGLHHYCASIHFLNRSRVERDARQRNFILQRALDRRLVQPFAGRPEEYGISQHVRDRGADQDRHAETG